MSKSIAAVVSKMVGDLSGLKSDEERERAFAGARAVLGMGNAINSPVTSHGESGASSPAQDGTKIEGVSSAGAAWIKRSGLSKDILEEYFHIEDGKVSLIGEAIGKGKREQSINTYLLTGVAALLESGKPDFNDNTARDYCTQLGCYDSPNHSGALAQFGNKVTGSKNAGWKLTSPGLTAAAALLNPKAQDNK